MSQNLIVYGLFVLAVAAVLFVAYPYLSGDIKAEKRRAAMQSASPRRGGERVVEGGSRRKQVADSIKEMEKRSKRARKITLPGRIAQAGLTMKVRTYWLMSAGLAVVLGFVTLVMSENTTFALAAAGIGGFGLPNWWLRMRGRKRITRFINEFPNAVDIIVRGIRAGLPLADCLRVIANEAAEPVRSEFRLIMESQAIGLSLAESVERITERVPIPEANFFSIVISLQSKSGGNLSEALGNLSRVLRERKKMGLKIKAMSSEAKTSAGIIGAMPFFVAFFVYLTTPDYISMLWTVTTGRIVLGCCAVWMGIGILVMRKLINFDF